MNKPHILKSILLLLTIGALFIIGCSVNQQNATEKGDLVLNIGSQDLDTMTIEPPIVMTIVTYDVRGTGPGGATFEQLDVTPGTAVVQPGLEPGTWIIEVWAKNSVPMTIGYGSTVVVILPGEISQATVTVYPVVGDGTLDVTITWPFYPTGPSILGDPGVVSTLAPVGKEPWPIIFTIAGNNLSAHYSDSTLDNGYYKLSVKLYEGDTAVPSNKIWGTVEAARIIAGQTSSRTYALTNEVGLGLVEVTINPQLQNPLNITFSGDRRFLPQGENMTVIATVKDENNNIVTPDSYEWYLDGDLVSEATTNTITIGSALSPDTYWLDLVVIEGPIISSATVIFEVVAQDQKLLFASNRDGDNEIFAANADTSNFPIQITSNVSDDSQPAWSPDLRKIAFISSRDGNPELYVMDADGTAVTKLSTTAATEKAPAWSPDGTKIAFASDVDGNYEIYVVSASGGIPAQLTITDSGSNDDPTWSPDGLQIAYTSTYSTAFNNKEIFVMNSDGSGTRTNYTNFLANDFDPSWSPDGAKIAFVSDRAGGGNKEVYYLVVSSPGTQVRLTTNSAAEESPVWSPSGAKIAFATNRDGNYEIYVMNSDGSSQTRVTTAAGEDIQPEW